MTIVAQILSLEKEKKKENFTLQSILPLHDLGFLTQIKAKKQTKKTPNMFPLASLTTDQHNVAN